MKSKKRALNIQLPEDLAVSLEQYVSESGYNKTHVVMDALKHYLALKNEEMDFKASYPDRRVKSRVVLEVMPSDDEVPRMASLLMY